MNKLIGLSVLVLGLVMLGGVNAEAGSSRAGSKGYVVNNYSTSISTVSVKPAALYQVIIGTGTAGTDYTALFDLASGTTIVGASANTSKMRLHVSSATQNTVITFDPPIQFNNGIYAVNSAVGISSTYVYEQGRPTGN